MDGLIPFVLKALKKKTTMKYYRSLSSSSGRLAHRQRRRARAKELPLHDAAASKGAKMA
jgi:hypothetical protein